VGKSVVGGAVVDGNTGWPLWLVGMMGCRFWSVASTSLPAESVGKTI
jgi:hypothetical protein